MKMRACGSRTIYATTDAKSPMAIDKGHYAKSVDIEVCRPRAQHYAVDSLWASKAAKFL